MLSVLRKTDNFGIFESHCDYTPITALLAGVDFTQIEMELNKHLDYSHRRTWRYSPILLFKLLIVLAFRKQTYRTVVNSLTTEDCIALEMKEISSSVFQIPCSSTLHDFAYNRLGLDGFKKIMELNGSIACNYIRNGHGMIDSTPIETSRYDRYAKYNPHYETKMYKMHIFHMDAFPLYEIFSSGTDSDDKYALPLAEKVCGMNPDLKSLQLDGGYDSYLIHAGLWKTFKINPLIDMGKNAVFHKEGTEFRIDHWVNKLWKKGGQIYNSIEKKLIFLYNNGREKQVGMYLRNQNLIKADFKAEYKSRSDCERTHSHMKRMFHFTVKWVQQRSKEFYMAFRFVSYQTILLARLLKLEPDIQNFSQYI